MAINTGDLHNFGRRSRLSPDGHMIKHRSLRPESLFFSPRSKIREAINTIFGHGLLPALNCDEDFSVSLEPRKMQFLKLQKASQLSPAEARQCGAMVAVMALFGVTDNHSENTLIGHRGSSFYFVPVDLETMFLPLTCAYDLGLFRRISSCSCPSPYCLNYGLSGLQGLLSEEGVMEVIQGHESMREQLVHQVTDLQGVLESELNGVPFVRRVLLKNTHTYAEALASGNHSGMRPEEVQQLVRGDVPYFFQVAGDEKVYYWTGETTKAEVSGLTIPFASLQTSRGLADDISLALAQTLDPGPSALHLQGGDVEVFYKGNSVILSLAGRVLTTRRLL